MTSAKAYGDSNIVRYNQFHQSPEGREKAVKLGYGDILDFDALTEFWVNDVDQFKAFTESEDFINPSGTCKTSLTLVLLTRI